MKGLLLLLIAFVLAGVAAAPVGPRYGDTIAAAAMARYRLVGLHIAAKTSDGAPIDIVTGASAASASAPLRNAMGTPIGTLSIAGGGDPAPVAGWLSRRIYVADNLVEPDPYVSAAVRSPRAQTLTEHVLARFPDLVTIALHVGPAASGRIVASSFGRIGKVNDSDDAHVVRNGAVLREATDHRARVAIELPLLDRRGRTIGALSTSFRAAEGGNGMARAEAVRAMLARAIASAHALDGTQR